MGINHTVLREQIQNLILQRIVEGEYHPGERLVETRIAAELEVSQAPVREALRHLEQLGCVVSQPHRGCSVRAFSAHELLEAFPVRAALEALAASLAVERIDEQELATLAELIERMRAAAQQGDPLAQSRANAQFHATIVRAARNGTLERQWALLEPFSRTYISASRQGIDLRDLAERHVPILEALRRGDGDGAAEAMRDHLGHAADVLRDGLRSEGSSHGDPEETRV